MKFVILALAFISVALAAKIPKTDFRNEFDHLLMQTSLQGMENMEQSLLKLQTEIDQLQVTKSKAEQDRIVQEIEGIISFSEGMERTMERELARKDLNLLEKFNFEWGLKTLQILVTDVKEAEVKVKAIQTK